MGDRCSSAPISALEARLFHEHEIPWDEIAFRTVRETLKHYFACRASGECPLRIADIG